MPSSNTPMVPVNPGKNVYIGMRYVPKLMGEWDSSIMYEPLSIVQYNGNSYTSSQYVPEGTDITNVDYWMLTGNYNGQLSALQNQVNAIQKSVDSFPDDYAAASNVIYNARFYGVEPDTRRDVTDVINAALSTISADGGTLILEPGTYVVNGEIKLPENVSLVGIPGAIIDASKSDAECVVRIKGRLGAPTSVTSIDVNKFNVSSTASITPGAWVQIYDSENTHSIQPGTYKVAVGEIARVHSVSGNLITLSEPLHESYGANSAFCAPIAVVENAKITGLMFKGKNIPGSGQSCIISEFALNLDISNCVFDGFDYYNCGIISSINVTVQNCRINGVFYTSVGSNFYGVAVLDSSTHVTIDNCSSSYCRSLFVCTAHSIYPDNTEWFGEPYDVIVQNCHAYNCQYNGSPSSAYLNHGFGQKVTIANNFADGCFAGALVQGRDTVVTGNQFVNFTRYAVSIYDNASNTVVSNNSIYGVTSTAGGIYITSTATNTQIIGNLITFDDNAGIGVTIQSADGSKLMGNRYISKAAAVSGYAIRTASQTSIINEYTEQIGLAVATADTIIKNCTININSGYPLYIQAGNHSIDGVYTGSTSLGSFATSATGVIAHCVAPNCTSSAFGGLKSLYNVLANTQA